MKLLKNSLTKKKRPSLSSKKVTDGPMPQSQTPSDCTTPSQKWYTTIADLPLKIFITCIVTGDLSHLIIEGRPTPQQLAETWAVILQEHADAIGTAEHKLYTSLCRTLIELQHDYNAVETFVPLLQKFYVKEFAKEVNKALRMQFKFDWKNGQLYQKELEKAWKMLKGLKLRIDQKAEQIQAMRAANEGGEPSRPATREHFLAALVSLSNHVKYRIDDSITVYEYCKRIHDYNEYIRQWQQKKK